MRLGTVAMAGRLWRVSQAPECPVMYDDGWRVRALPAEFVRDVRWEDEPAREAAGGLRLVPAIS